MKEKILRAAAKIISNDGLESASTRAICEAVGITAPTLYHHFKGKHDLLDSVTAFAFDLHRKKKLEQKTKDPIKNLRIYWDGYMNFCLAEPELQRTMIVAISQGQSIKTGFECFRDLLFEFKSLEAKGELVHSALQSAQMFLGAAQGLSIIIMSLPPANTLPQISTDMREVMLTGLVKTKIRKELSI